MNSFRYYIPGLIPVGLGILFIYVPEVAAFLLSLVLFFFGGIYLFFVYRIQKAKRHFEKKQKEAAQDYASDAEFNNVGDPTFKTITIRMFKSGGFYDS